MSNLKKLQLNKSGVKQLLKSKELEAGLNTLARDIASRAGEGYYSDTKQMGSRVIASAYTGTSEAMKENLENNTLLKAIQ